MTLEVLFCDEHLVVVNKPPGLLVHRSKIDPHANEFAVQLVRDLIGRSVYLVHRLDRPTSGVLVFGFSPSIAADLCEQFANRQVKKSYRAIVRGHTAGRGSWDEPLLEKVDRFSDRNARTDKPAQSAVTDFKTVRSWEIPLSTGKYPSSRYSEVHIQPRTGRKHQIRRHFNHMAHPIVGDSTYGDRRHNRLFRERLGIRRLLLVAHKLRIRHPDTGQLVEFEAPVGSEFELARYQLSNVE